MIIAPHADDETLGCGGTIPILSKLGYHIHWVLVTNMKKSKKYGFKEKELRLEQIEKINHIFQFSSFHQMNYEPAELSNQKQGDLIMDTKKILDEIQPDTIFVPYRDDAHSDHASVFDACAAASKTFRSPFIEKIYAYETLSETEFDLKPSSLGFRPTTFVNIEDSIMTKLEAMEVYSDQLGVFPFPRCEEAIVALSNFRGIQSGHRYAESFMLIKDTNHFTIKN